MKLSSIKQTIDNALPILSSFKGQTVGQSLRINGLFQFKEVLNELKKVEVFNEQLDMILSFNIMSKIIDTGDVPVNEARVLMGQVADLTRGLSFLSKSLGQILTVEQERMENTVYVKLPNTINLEELSKDIEVFNKIFSLTILNPKIDGEIRFESVEPGSVWLKIYVGTAAAITLIGSLTWSSAVVYKKYQEAKLIEELVIQKELENDHRAKLIEASKTLTDFIIEAEAEHLYRTYYDSGEIDNEQMERIKRSIKLLSDQIYKGAEINPALTAPEDVANLFPDMKSLPLIESKIKRIGN